MARLLTLLAWSGLAPQGCAARPSNDAAFRQLQLREAELTRSGRELESASACSAAARAALQRITLATDQLCQLSRALQDRDATRRCLRAEDARRAAREHAPSNCATSAR